MTKIVLIFSLVLFVFGYKIIGKKILQTDEFNSNNVDLQEKSELNAESYGLKLLEKRNLNFSENITRISNSTNSIKARFRRNAPEKERKPHARRNSRMRSNLKYRRNGRRARMGHGRKRNRQRALRHKNGDRRGIRRMRKGKAKRRKKHKIYKVKVMGIKGIHGGPNLYIHTKENKNIDNKKEISSTGENKGPDAQNDKPIPDISIDAVGSSEATAQESSAEEGSPDESSKENIESTENTENTENEESAESAEETLGGGEEEIMQEDENGGNEEDSENEEDMEEDYNSAEDTSSAGSSLGGKITDKLMELPSKVMDGISLVQSLNPMTGMLTGK